MHIPPEIEVRIKEIADNLGRDVQEVFEAVLLWGLPIVGKQSFLIRADEAIARDQEKGEDQCVVEQET